MKSFPIPSQPAPSGGEKPPPLSANDDDGDEVNGYAKGGPAMVAHYAAGGPVLGRSRSFLKEPDGPDQTVNKFKVYKNPSKAENTYGKKGKGDLGAHPDKSLSPVKPRK